MKGFFSCFDESAAELNKTSTLTVTGMLIALSLVLRNISIYVTEDIRIGFAFIGGMAIAMLFGPSVAVLGETCIDIIGYLLDGKVARDYNIWLLLIKLAAIAICGILLYKKNTGKTFAVRIIIARGVTDLIFQMIFNSCVLYACYKNPHFPVMTSSEWDAFFIWIAPRVIKNLIMLPIECIMAIFILPLIKKSHERVFHKKVIKE